INEQKELVGVVHAGKPAANLMTMYIDVKSVREFLGAYYKSKGAKKSILDERPPAERNDEIPILVKRLENGEPDQRAKAAKILGQFGVQGKPAVDALLKALADKDESVRTNAAEALELIGGLTQRHLPLIIEALKDGTPDVRLAAIAAIKLMQAEADSAAPA